MNINTEVEIDAPPAAVWAQLTDLDAYEAWNPHIVAARGDLVVGSALDITVAREGTRDRSMTVTVTKLDPERWLAWVARLVSPLVFEGKHVFELERLDDHRTLFVNREAISGILTGLVVTDDPRVDYEKMNAALKARVERTAKTGAA